MLLGRQGKFFNLQLNRKVASCLVRSHGPSFSVQNNLGGAKLLAERIVSALDALELSDVVIGMESTSIYGNHLVHSLREDGCLGRYQRKIHVLNPKQVSKFKVP